MPLSPQVPQICMCTEWAVVGVAPFSLLHELAVYVCVCVQEGEGAERLIFPSYRCISMAKDACRPSPSRSAVKI